MNQFIEKLEWDTDFFNLEIAQIKVNQYNYVLLEKNLRDCRANGLDLVYVFTEKDCILPESITGEYDCQLVDKKFMYECLLNEHLYVDSNVLEFNGKAEQLYELAFQSGVDSRFRIDKNFVNNEFEKLYKIWVDNSVNHQIADRIFVYKLSDNIVGFVTLKIRNAIATIGLIATDTSMRGKGIGTLLINYCKNYALRNGAQKIQVATQEKNKNARFFYEKNNMYLISTTNIYHFWL